VAVGLARLGVQARFAGRISRDLVGSFLRAHLERNGVDLTLSVGAPEPATLAIVGLDDAGSASYSFHVEGTADWQWTEAELPVVSGGEAVHTGSLALALEPGADLIAEWLAALHERCDVFLSLDPNVRPSLVLDQGAYRERLKRVVSLATLVKVSDEDLRTLEPEAEPLDIASRWQANGPELIVVTHGAHGSTALVAGAQPVHRDARAAHVVDTVGAGDAFTAGLLTFFAEHEALAVGLRDRLDSAILEQMLDFASCVAALTCERAGADPPSREAVGQALPAFAGQVSG